MKTPKSVPRGEWEKLDWNRTARTIATELGVSYPTVFRWSHKLGKTLVPDLAGRPPKVDWSRVDFEQPTNELASALQTSARHVRRMKKRWNPDG